MTNYDAEREELEIEYMSRFDYISEAFAGSEDRDYEEDEPDYMPGGVHAWRGVEAMCRAIYALACRFDDLPF